MTVTGTRHSAAVLTVGPAPRSEKQATTTALPVIAPTSRQRALRVGVMGSPHHHDGFHERMRRAVERELARLCERVCPGLARLDRPRIPRAVVRGKRVDQRVVVGPLDRGACSDLEPLLPKVHPAYCGLDAIRRPFAFPRRRCTPR